MAARDWDEGEPMTAVGLLSTTAFLLSCGVHPDDLGEAWSVMRKVQHQAEYPSQMGPLVQTMREYAQERAYERARELSGIVGRHTGAIVTLT